MTPEAVEALREVADGSQASAAATREAATAIAGLELALLADQEDARKREAVYRKEQRDRFRWMYRLIGAVLLLNAVILTVNYRQAQDSAERDRQAATVRDDRARLTEAQRKCSDVVTKDALGRLSDMAVIPRYQTNPDGSTVLDAQGNPVPLSQAELLVSVEQYRKAVVTVNPILHNIDVVCYGPKGPDPTPLDPND